MRLLRLSLLVLSLSLSFYGCTNDEGDEDIDVITPADEEETVQLS
ncbi:hypothetical protein [Allomuricauda sp. d1]